MSVLKRLAVLQQEAESTPVPARKFFHIGKPETVEDVGECIPMISWVDDNLSRYVVSNAPSNSWGIDRRIFIRCLPNIAVKNGEGVFLVTGCGDDESVPHPAGKGRMHFVHLNLDAPVAPDGHVKVYVYRLEGVQVKVL